MKGTRKDTYIEDILARASLHRAPRIIFFLGVVVLILFFSGYRLSGLDAAKAHLSGLYATKANFDVENHAEPFGEIDMGWGKVYLFNTVNGPRTVGCYKTGVLWRCPVSIWFYNYSTEAVQTVGWMSWTNGENEQVTVMAVQTIDPRVSFIETGQPSERIQKNISIGTPTIFNWSNAMSGYSLNPVALAPDGHILYEYRYPKNTTAHRSEDYRWYPVDRDV